MRWKIRNSAWKRCGRPFLLFISSSFVFLFFFLPLEDLGSIVSEIEINGLYSITKEELLYLLDIKVDGPTDPDKVREGIKRAFLKGIFEDISVEATDGEQVRVTITVTERDFINKILIEGDYNLSKKFIKNTFSLREGQVLRQDLIEPAMKKLQQDIVRRGFPHVSIEVKTEKLKKPYRANLHLWVYTGEPEMIKEIIISGGTDETERLMKLSEGDIYDQAALEDDIKRVKTYYRKNGYFQPRIESHTFTGGVLKIPVDPGKRLFISTEGNSVFSTKTLRKEMPFFEAENFNDDLVEEAVSKMLSLYHTKGYPFAQVAPVITSKDDTINLSLFIFEGKKVKVESINFSGVSL
jgi:outer membrane protein insertion porin family